MIPPNHKPRHLSHLPTMVSTRFTTTVVVAVEEGTREKDEEGSAVVVEEDLVVISAVDVDAVVESSVAHVEASVGLLVESLQLRNVPSNNDI